MPATHGDPDDAVRSAARDALAVLRERTGLDGWGVAREVNGAWVLVEHGSGAGVGPSTVAGVAVGTGPGVGGADALTGLPDRTAWEVALTEAEDRCRRGGRYAAVVAVRVVAAGHVAPADADRLVSNAARVVAGKLRGSDLVARVARDELAVLLPDTDLASAILVATRLEELVGAAGVFVSAGVAGRDPAAGLGAAWEAARRQVAPDQRPVPDPVG